ncbi:Putative membrane lipoprotein [Arabidopsis thaliana]|uniref:Defensin-like protein 220 n=1 Tax=Arabidopsis thaliana TaxID=3702 RepID=DF220_ARATH|nr:Putative membrane lipoprotein [Arabidopsis thaliana]Q2V304.1 RecName: Full=Defensin-like protein 220; Flags: Precursor [Arabidopsis thaliana]AED95696.1 Putative membrane lipoprotein [Arabidopsis thaliana]|eukprot:NP_001032036.1 Putative membrane lipoprotein [Arabidopsis thaliana]
MKTIFFFITFIVLVSSCTSNIMTKSISQVKSQFFSPALSPNVDPADEHIGHSPDDMKIIFCQQCAFHCIEKKKNIGNCENSICRCTLEDIL